MYINRLFSRWKMFLSILDLFYFLVQNVISIHLFQYTVVLLLALWIVKFVFGNL